MARGAHGGRACARARVHARGRCSSWGAGDTAGVVYVVVVVVDVTVVSVVVVTLVRVVVVVAVVVVLVACAGMVCVVVVCVVVVVSAPSSNGFVAPNGVVGVAVWLVVVIA